MGVLLRTSRPIAGRKPAGPSLVNFDHPSALGLLSFVDMTAGRGVVDLMSGSALQGAASVLGCPGGTGAGFTTANARSAVDWTRTRLARLTAPYPLTVDVWAFTVGTPTDYAGLHGIVYATDGSAPYSIISIDRSAGAVIRLSHQDGALAYAQLVSAETVPTTLSHICGVVNNNAQTLYLNGRVIASASAGLAGSLATSATTQLYAGEAFTASGRSAGASVLCGRIWSRALSASEVWELYAQPWDLYWQPGRTLYFDVGAAAAGQPTVKRYAGVPHMRRGGPTFGQGWSA